MIMNFTFDHITAVALLYFPDKISLFIIKFTAKFVLNNINNRSIIEFIWALWEILATMHALNHRSIHACSSDDFIFRCATSKPTVPLQP